MSRTKPWVYVSASRGKEEKVYVTLKILDAAKFLAGVPDEGPWGRAVLTPGKARQLARYLERAAGASIRNRERVKPEAEF